MNKTLQHARMPRTLWTFYVFLMVINGVVPAATLAADVNGVADGFANAASPRRGNERILSRKRRYLIFPQGSSLQLGECGCMCVCVCKISWNWDQMAFNSERSCSGGGVLIKIARARVDASCRYPGEGGRSAFYLQTLSLPHCTSAVYDMVYPILDKANVAYIGITGALAYQLPYEPISIDAVFRRPEPSPASDNSDDRISADNAQMPQPAPTNPTANNSPRPPVDRYYNQPQDLYFRAPPAKTTGGTYYIGSEDSPPDRFTAPSRVEPGVVDASTNKMDYYFSYADRLMQTLNSLNRRKIDPWKQVSWTAAEKSPSR